MDASMEPVVTLFSKYIGEFESTAESVRVRGAALSKEARQRLSQVGQAADGVCTTLLQKRGTLLDSVADLGPVPFSVDFAFMFETYMWSAVVQWMLGVGQLLGALLIGPLLLRAVFDVSTLGTLVYALLPMHFHLLNRKRSNPASEEHRRLQLLLFALLVGVGSGHLLSGRALPPTPPGFLHPLVVGVSVQVGETMTRSDTRPFLQVVGRRVANGDRRLFLLSTVGMATVVYLLYGWLRDVLSFTYLLVVVIATAISTMNMQLMVAGATDGRQGDLIAGQAAGLMQSMYMQLLLSFVVGFAKTQMMPIVPQPTPAM